MSFKGHSAAVYLNVLNCDLFRFCTLAPQYDIEKQKSGFITVSTSSCGKVIFLHLSVSQYVHREGVCMAGGHVYVAGRRPL